MAKALTKSEPILESAHCDSFNDCVYNVIFIEIKIRLTSLLLTAKHGKTGKKVLL
jgi:hypothetical protein